MKLGIIISRSDPESVYNILRLGVYAVNQGDEVKVFLSGAGVEIDRIDDASFDVRQQAQALLDAGGAFFACGSCLKLRASQGTEVCPLSTLRDEYDIVRDSDKVLSI
ncbi:MAG: DsrE family protein [Candidatus Hydrogenedentes bacterium]|nr:DsrE family protein [Candidatus Hydrogenedentota bacterium]